MNLGRLVRFFFLVTPRQNAVVFAVLAAGAIAFDLLSTVDHSAILVCILFLQMFACSCGYVTHGSRGYYDPVLTAGAPKWSVGIAHLAAAATPGVLAWLAIATWSAIRGGPESDLGLRPASIVFLLLVSTVSWAITLRLPTMVGAALWTFLSIATVVSSEFLHILARSFRSSEALVAEPWRALLSGLLVPTFSFAAPWPALHVAAFASIALIALGLGLLFIARRDLPLAEEE
jgi:hypothetical protein